jgi:hypothetical protein
VVAPPDLVFIEDGAAGAEATLVLAHGAGAPMDSPFMNWWASALAERAVRVVRFEFPYMRQRRENGGKRPPDREAVLLVTWREVARRWPGAAIGGKSMGGRIASMVADEAGAVALVCLGYPFHAPGRPEKPRIAHLKGLATRTLIVQGSNDPFGRHDEVSEYKLAERIQFAWIEGGNHDLERRGEAPESTWLAAVERVAAFLLE